MKDAAIPKRIFRKNTFLMFENCTNNVAIMQIYYTEEISMQKSRKRFLESAIMQCYGVSKTKWGKPSFDEEMFATDVLRMHL